MSVKPWLERAGRFSIEHIGGIPHFNQAADLGAEQAIDLGTGCVRILDRVVQERRHDRGIVELEVGQKGRDLQRMREIRIA